ncbi:NADP-reducing hydrogenase subunit HndC [Anaerohalosphaera lusitana]|uniref:NADP-reducing hydrogenase subunit HndC n=1 Tax=Anaerohalosphaera lusitana TaxID=1936003 RepID=A0A1U9NL91_9BACT|nr:NADH-dependent [FeFe] hydrogenase, group A6 [Anaerohalosphaera lusitana]AQT68276.1 NADP-reducing hydrogenase subunit HndC [Anaerohalosphaera lusitana]
MSDMIKIYINGREYEVAAGQTIMEAADKLGYHIPRLCYHPKLSIEGACRVCIVEVEGMRNFVASCAYPVTEGMKIRTNTKEIRRTRRDIVELILDNHPQDCHTCERNSNCELQRLSESMGIQRRHFEGEKKHYDKDLSSPAVVRDPDKCILCGRCVRMCSEVQNIHNLTQAHRGFKTVVMPAYNMPMDESVCSTCGQCINVCPTAAFMEYNYTQDLFEKLNDDSLTKVVQFAPAVRAAIGEAFGMAPGNNMEGQLVAALRKLGFDYVFDTQFSADLTIMEEGSEFLERLQNKGKLPLITSCSPGWMKCVEQFYPDMLDNISTCKSPMSMAGALIKTYFAEKIETDPKKILSVAVMPCTAKKYEADRPELEVDGMKTTDIVITTRELAWMIKSAGLDFINMPGEKPDAPMGVSSGAGAIFGVTGGVMEAAIRTAYELFTGETLVDIEMDNLRGLSGVKEGKLEIDGEEIRIAVAHGLGNASKLFDIVRKEPDRFHFIEIMGCPGGCIGGGGQPYCHAFSESLGEECLAARAKALYDIDRGKTIRRSLDNPDVQKLYKEYLQRPMSEMSHKLLHTHYKAQEPKGIIPAKSKR